MRSRSRGLTLIELLVALTIGSLLVAGAVYVYSQSRKTHTVTETIARLQENGRYVFSLIEPDIQLAGYYGYSNAPDDFKFITGGSTASAVPAARLIPTMDDVLGVAETVSCGKNFLVNLSATVQGTNKTYSLGCAPQGGGTLDGPDTLTVRRASSAPSDGKGAAVANRLQLFVSRLSPTNQYVISDGSLPASPDLKADFVQVRDLIVRTYYISKDSTSPDAVGLPALRVKSLTNGPAFNDDEVMRGVEDLQVQFGIDTGSYDGNAAIDSGRDQNGDGIADITRGTATYYVNPDSVPLGAQVISVRVWVLLRAEQAEQGFVNDTNFVYADRNIPAKNDGYRRVLMSRTIQLRNSRVL
ncbi:MAG: PilW family protein [Gammaproteobacteria bacterium]